MARIWTLAPSRGRFREPCTALPLLSAMTRKVGSGSFPFNIHSAPPASGSNPPRLPHLIQETAFSEVGSWQDVSRAAACPGVYRSMGNSRNLRQVRLLYCLPSTTLPLSSVLKYLRSAVPFSEQTSIHPSIHPSNWHMCGWNLHPFVRNMVGGFFLILN